VSAGRAPGRPKPARIPSGDRPMYSSAEGLTFLQMISVNEGMVW
jgi:hypothetical protein